MKTYVVGKGSVDLNPSNLLGSGGEGSVYVVGNTAYKVYHDPKKMLPLGKISELQRIQDPEVIRPQDVLQDSTGTPIGYTMPYVSSTQPICVLFPPEYRSKHNITQGQVSDLVRGLRDRYESVHKAGSLIVDGNELNFLIPNGYNHVYAIDCDSYQTPSYPATAIMPSILDPNVVNGQFTKESDWFSFGIVSFNLFVGVHPFKGNHPTLRGFADRMKARVSVLNSSVQVPKMVLPFSNIPQTYLEWYTAIFERGVRVAPPSSFTATVYIQPVIQNVGGTNLLDVVEVWTQRTPIQGVWDVGAGFLTWNTEDVYLSGLRVGSNVVDRAIGVATHTRPILVGHSHRKVTLYDLVQKAEISHTIEADQVMMAGSRVYVLTAGKVSELQFRSFTSKIIVGAQVAAEVMPTAARMFPGCVVATNWVTLFPQSGVNHHIALKELEHQRVIHARYENGGTPASLTGVLCTVSVCSKGVARRMVFRFDKDFTTYDVSITEGVDIVEPNFVVLESGVVVLMTEDALEVFSVRKDSLQKKVVADPILSRDMTLIRYKGGLGFWRGGKVYSMRMK